MKAVKRKMARGKPDKHWCEGKKQQRNYNKRSLRRAGKHFKRIRGGGIEEGRNKVRNFHGDWKGTNKRARRWVEKGK